MRTNVHLSAHLLSVTAPATSREGTALAAAAGAFAARRSAGLIFFHGRDGVDVASATCVRVGGRTFLATAGHNLDGVRRDRDLRIIPPGSSRDRWLPYLGRNFTRHRLPESYDVGWIEIDPGVAADAGLLFLDAGSPGRRRAAAAPADGERCYLVHGLPAGLATHGLHARGRVIHLTLLGYQTFACDHGTDAELRQARLSLWYDWTESDDGAHGPPARGRLPAAHGLSGGGVWRIDRRADADEPPRLVAIVRAWHRRERRLACVSIERWLELVRRDFSDLRPAIDPLL